MHYNSVEEKAVAELHTMAAYGVDTILYINAEIPAPSNMPIIDSVSVRFPWQFKLPSSDWSDVSGYKPLMRLDFNGTYKDVGPTGTGTPLVYSADSLDMGSVPVKISGYIKVGVNA